jgi:hypothetical protein
MKLKIFILALLFVLLGALPSFAVDATKSADVVLLAHQAVTHPDTAIGTAISVVDDFLVCGAFFYAPVETDNPDEGSFFRLQYSVSASGNEDWVTFPGTDFRGFDTASDTESLNSTEAAGETDLNVPDASAQWDHGDSIYIQDAGTVADGEWNIVEDLDTTPQEYVKLLYGLTNGKDSSDAIWEADVFSWCVDVSAITRIRVYFSNANSTSTGPNAHIKATATKFTDIQ